MKTERLDRRKILTVVGLLIVAGVCLFWLHGGRKPAASGHEGPAPNATASAAKNGPGAGSGAALSKISTLNTNKLAFRLSNTTNTIRQLQSNPHAILLANAFIDTDKPLDLKIPSHLRAAGDPGAYIVQAHGATDGRFRALLQGAGAQIISYIPNNAYLVHLSASGANELAASGRVQAVLPYEPYYKLQPSLLGLAVNQKPLPPATVLTLGLFAGDPAAEQEIEKLGGKIIGHDQSPFGPVLRVLAPPDWTSLVQSPVVQFAEPAHRRMAANDLSRVTVGVSPDTTSPLTNGYAVQGRVLTGQNVLVEVNDSGIDATHPDFDTGGTAQGAGGGPVRVLSGRGSPIDLVDTNGHGTHVAGIIAGNGEKSYTVSANPVWPPEGSVTNADFRGKAPSATLVSVAAFGNTFAKGVSDDVLQGIAAATNALISNNSWTYGNADYDLAAASYDAATRDALPFVTGSQPVLFVFAAGNSGGGDDQGQTGAGDTIQSPGTAKNVITVGALEQLRNITNYVTYPDGTSNQFWLPKTDTSTEVADYSSRGNVGIGTEGTYGRFKPDLVSPGNFVISTRSQQWDTNIYYNLTNNIGNYYSDQTVTTNFLDYYPVSTPANTVAVIIRIFPNVLSPNPFPPDFVIYCQQSDYPDPVNAPNLIDLTTYTNSAYIPPGGGNCTIPNLQATGGFIIGIGEPTNYTANINFDLDVEVLVTNNLGNMQEVLQGMNDDQLKPWYRFESGTSMAAADASGVLALIQDYFTNTLSMTPSPALLKALLINGTRSIPGYKPGLTNAINFEGWGLDNIAACVPSGGLFYQPDGNTTGSSFFVDQSTTNALATGDSRTYVVTVNTNTFASAFRLTATLVWTDPPGDPAAAVKLVNNLELIITNMTTGNVYYGNDISGQTGYNLAWNTNFPPNIDTINNVQNILLPAGLSGAQYSVTVVGRDVNANAVTAQLLNSAGQFAPNVVQDYALVISIGEGEVTNAFTVAPPVIASNPTGDQDITFVTTTNSPLFDQFAGASSPLLGTNTLPLGTNTDWGSNGVVTIGQTNQWHFYVVTNTGPGSDFTNAAFMTFDVNTLSIPRMGVEPFNVQGIANSTRPEADIDLFVTQDPSITNLSPVAISNCLAGLSIGGVGDGGASVTRGGTEFVYFTNSSPGQVYYVGVKSEDREAAEYAFLPIFTDIPFSGLDNNGNQIVNGLLLPMAIPSGNNAHPGVTNIFALAIMPMEVEKVTVTNWDQYQQFGDLVGALKFSGQGVVLNSHDGFGNTILGQGPMARPIVYDDSRNHPLGTTNSDGPGSLIDFRGKSALGPWILSLLNDSAGGFTGQVARLTLLIQPHRDLNFPGVIVDVPPGGWFIDYVDVAPGYTNLTFTGTNVSTTIVQPAIQMYTKLGNEPTLTDYDQEATLTNGIPPGNSISTGPPLPAGRYFVGLFNPNTTTDQHVLLSARLGIDQSTSDIFDYTATSGTPLPDDAVTANPNVPVIGGSTIRIANTVTQQISSVSVGLVVTSPRISDYTFTLVSPIGQRVLLMENRGGSDTNGAGEVFVYTNVLNSTATGGAEANTNYLPVDPLGGTVPITYNFYTVPDEMTVYDTTNPVLFASPGPNLLLDTGFTNNVPAGSGAQNTVPVTVNVTYPIGVSNITIIMNQFGNPYAAGGDAWIYTAGAPITNYQYLVFTDNTNLANVPIKYAEPPFNFNEFSTNYQLSDLDFATNGDYFGPTNINDQFGGWIVPTNLVTYSSILTNINTTNVLVTITNNLYLTNNLVSVVSDPSVALTGDTGGSNYLALAYGTITRSIPTTPGRIYNVTFWYRGPDVAGWWRGEGNGNDSSDPENDNNNGALVGRFDFPAGEVDQAFELEDPGNTYQFAGTNTYVQVPSSTSLNVGTGGGFTLEGWINPTNLTYPQPLFEWLSRIPTNTAITNVVIKQGPVLDPATGNYYYLLGATNWKTSELWAEEMGGHLVTIPTANLENWVYDTFTDYGAKNRWLWTGLAYTNNAGTVTFGWSSGYTNLTYTNWAPGQPFDCGGPNGDENYVAIMGPTNAYPGLWKLEDNRGRTCDAAPTNPIYGVVELTNLPPIGVQFWVSATNSYDPIIPVSTNAGSLFGIIAGYYNTGSGTNYGAILVGSLPGLLTNNAYQHVALTYSTNTGLVKLYLNGTNIPVSVTFTNLSGPAYTGPIPTNFIVPNTTGDMLLGHDMSHYTNNFFAGELDEMSVYARALSDAEILGIYNVSASTTNRMIGKFDASITPAIGLSEALVMFGSNSNIIYGANNQWQVNSFTFTATSNSMPLTISGIEPGILLDSFSVNEAPLTNLYYLPEQALDPLIGGTPGGDWTLQVWDNRVGAYVANVNQLVNWQLSFVLASNAVVSATLPPQTPVTTTPPAGQTVYYAVPVPVWAHEATNILVSANQPVNLLYFSTNNPPTGVNGPDATLLAGATSGVGVPDLVTNVAPPFNLPPGYTYYLGVQNLSSQLATVTLEVDYDILQLTNGAPFSGVLTNEYSSVRYFSYNVSSNAYEATFQLLKLQGNADLVVRKGAPLPDLSGDDYGSFNTTNADENIYVLTNSEPVPLSPGLWYLGVVNRDGGAPVRYSILAKELDITNSITNFTVIDLTNEVPFNWTMGPGAALTNFFHFHATNSVINGTQVNLSGLRFELYNLTGNGDLTVQTNLPPLAPPFFQSSQNQGNNPELIYVWTNNMMTNLAGDWFLGVPNREITNINYTIVVGILTNSYFPAFPGAVGAGGGAIGAGHAGIRSKINHVISTADSGPGTLRWAVGGTNRTVVFDIAGNIFLASPLVITNSYITIAGQSSPGGITVVGQMITITNVHDVIVRDIRFRTATSLASQTNNFEAAIATNYMQNQVVAAWTILTNQSSVVADRANANGRHTNFLALANGVISNSIATVPGRTYNLSLAYRGPGIAGWWRGEGNPPSRNDIVNGNNATTFNNISPTFGKVGGAFSLNGINNNPSSSVLAIPPSSSLTVTNVTLEGWIFPTTTSYEPIMEYDSPGQRSYLHFWLNGWGLSPTPGMLYVEMEPSEPVFFSASGIVPQNQWSHVACTLDVNSGLLAIYLNGVRVASTNLSTSSTILYPTAQNLNLGWRDPSCTEVLKGYDFGGRMDEMSVYNRALSPSEIKAIYTKDFLGKFDPAVFGTSPAQSLAEAALSIPGATTNVLLGNNATWQTTVTSFTATAFSTPVVISGIEPGMLLDSVVVTANGALGSSLQFNTASNLIADHISASWSTNNEMSVLNSSNVTVQWSIMADSLYLTNSLSTNGPVGAGSWVRQGGGMVSFYHNLYADNFTASPQFGDNLTLDFENNVIYNWGFRPGLTGGTNDLLDFSPNGCTNQLNYVCNYLIAGSDTSIFATNNYNITNIAFFEGGTNALAANWIFQTNNFIDSDTNGILNGSDTGWGMFTNGYTRLGRAFPTPPVPVDEAFVAYERVLDFAGVSLSQRDPVDTNIVTNVRYQTGRLISSPGTLPVQNSALPYLDTDQDGLPDFWERTFTPTLVYIPSNNNDRDGDGYTDLEEYNNWLAVPHGLTVTNTSVSVDLYQLCGESGHLAFYVTNSINGLTYITNVIGSVTNTSLSWSNTIAVFTPTNSTSGGTNYYGFASFSFYVTNLDTSAYFGPVPVSVIVSAVPIALNSNMPPVITPLVSGALDPTNYGGSDFYSIVVTTNDYGAVFEIDNPTGPMALVVAKDRQPSLSDYDYFTNAPPSPGDQTIAVLTNSTPVPLSPGTWYMAAVNISGSNVVYTAKITLFSSVQPPQFFYPTNTTGFFILETVPWSVNCVATDLNSPTLPLSFALVSGPTGLIVSNSVIYWTPTEAQGPSTNSVAVSVSNGSFSVTNTFTIVVEESNLPPVLPMIPNQFVIVSNTLVVSNTATDQDIPTNLLGYTLTSTVTGPNTPVIDTNGTITWTPIMAQAETNYLFQTVVTDTNPWAVNSQSLSATNIFGVFVVPTLNPHQPLTNIFFSSNVFWFVIPVPTNAIYATNTLLFSSLPVNIWFSTNIPPTITNTADRELLDNRTNGVCVLSTNLATAPTNIVQGGYYFLGVQNTNAADVFGAIEIDFALANPPPLPALTLPTIADQYIAAGDTLVVTNTATDTNANPTLIYKLIKSGPGAIIDANGIITWETSTDMPVPTNVLFTTVATDTGVNSSATNSFHVIVLPGLGTGLPDTNVVPPLGTNWFYVHVPPNADIATNILLFATAPVNLWFSTNEPPTILGPLDVKLLGSSTGGSAVIKTNSNPALVPGSHYFLGVQNPNPFTVTNAVDVKFHLLPLPPFSIFSIVQTNLGGTNGFLLTWFAPPGDQFHLQWTPKLVPSTWANFNGVISVQQSSSHLVATNGEFQYFDDGSQTGGFGQTRFYRLLLLKSPTNTAPFFLHMPTLLYARPSVPFVFTNSAMDWDIPPQLLIYSITNTLAGTNVSINPATGVIAWTPDPSLVNETNVITTTVYDNGIPAKGATNIFAVVVSTNSVSAPPSFGSIALVGNGMKFQWTAPANESFQIRWTPSLTPVNWHTFPDIITSATGSYSFVDTNSPLSLMRFYQLILLP